MYKDSVQGFVFAIRRHAYALYHVEIRRLLHVSIALYLRCKKVFVHKLVYVTSYFQTATGIVTLILTPTGSGDGSNVRRAIISLGKLLLDIA